MNELIKREIALLPNLPGIYLMYGKHDKIIYVGKAKNLRKRVSQYFERPQSGKVAAMVFAVERFDTIITRTEKEALILEMNLIHEHYPRYNIMLKDGSHYPYIALRKGSDPLLKIARNDKDPGYRYFGPFPNASAAYEMMNLLNKLFPLRKCKTMPKVPCLYYHLGQCLAPCINEISEVTYNQLIADIEAFLGGNSASKIAEMKARMIEASEKEEYELAGEYKKTLDAIVHITAKQNVENADHVDRDVFAIATRDGYLSLAVLLYRRGLLLGKELYVVEQFGEIEEQTGDLIAQFYQMHPRPREIVLSMKEIAASLTDVLDIGVIAPTRGKLYELVTITQKNAQQGLDDHFMTARLDDDKIALLTALGTILHIETPYHIELFDNSHLQGSSPVGAMVAFVNGEPAKKMYRKFHIEHDEKRDDFASMKEIVFRRYKRLSDEQKVFPDLIIVDGGQLQANAAREALQKAGVNVPLVGLYKNDKHQTKGLIDADGQLFEIADNPPLFYFLMRMQDEVHRFAISFHKQLRSKNLGVSILDGILGLGEARKETLRRVYPDLDQLRNASQSDLKQFIPEKAAEILYKKLHE
jgi:excinuclease ABC subunit C